MAEDFSAAPLDRIVDLAGVSLRLIEWPGLAGPLVHVPDPRSPDHTLVGQFAETLAPRYRVLSLTPRGDSAYQVDAADLLATLDQFGFATPVLLAEGLGCVAAVLLAAWHTGRVAGLVLVDPIYDPLFSDGLAARALQDCPPDWPALRRAIACPVLVLQKTAAFPRDVEQFLAQLEPGLT